MRYEVVSAIGLRVYPNGLGELRLPEGGYGKDMRGRWWARHPDGDTAIIDAARVTEHPDATVTVRGLIDGSALGRGHWRLERGLWTSVEAERAANRQKEAS